MSYLNPAGELVITISNATRYDVTDVEIFPTKDQLTSVEQWDWNESFWVKMVEIKMKPIRLVPGIDTFKQLAEALHSGKFKAKVNAILFEVIIGDLAYQKDIYSIGTEKIPGRVTTDIIKPFRDKFQSVNDKTSYNTLKLLFNNIFGFTLEKVYAATVLTVTFYFSEIIHNGIQIKNKATWNI